MAAARTTTTKVSTALVTGANRGIGLGIVRELLKRSGVSHVFAGYRSSAKIEELEHLRSEHAARLHLVPLEVTCEQSLAGAVRVVECALPAGARLDLLVNNAGYYGRENVNVHTPKLAALQPHFDVNACGPVLTTAAFLPLLKRQGQQSQAQALVVNISSKLGSITQLGMPPAGNVVYCMSKAALNLYTRFLANAEPSLIVVSVCPGWVQTDMGGANAAVTVDQSVGFIVGRVLGELGPADSGTFFGADGPEPF